MWVDLLPERALLPVGVAHVPLAPEALLVWIVGVQEELVQRSERRVPQSGDDPTALRFELAELPGYIGDDASRAVVQNKAILAPEHDRDHANSGGLSSRRST